PKTNDKGADKAGGAGTAPGSGDVVQGGSGNTSGVQAADNTASPQEQAKNGADVVATQGKPETLDPNGQAGGGRRAARPRGSGGWGGPRQRPPGRRRGAGPRVSRGPPAGGPAPRARPGARGVSAQGGGAGAAPPPPPPPAAPTEPRRSAPRWTSPSCSSSAK